uniref:Family with sequence similarity 208, member Ab n=1 Tax=Nothobranchius pienaari TaxID=704102 RepID=A0A1A8MAS5_9TELE
MDNDFSRGVTYRQANASSHANDVVISTRKPHPTGHRLSSATKRMERRKSAPQVVHQRHMPKEPNKFHIPRKNKEQKSLFQFVSTESREYEDMKTILISSYIDTNSSSCFIYSNPRLVHSELLEKEFVEKRKEMKADGRTEKELEESYCFLLTTLTNLPALCEKGLVVAALLSSLIPFLPHRLPEKLDVGNLMRFDQLTKLMPSGLLSYDLYNSSKEVVADGCYCSLLEVVDRSCSSVNMTKLLLQLERKRVVLHLTMATSITTTTKPARTSPTMSPEHSSHHPVTRYPSPIPSPTASSPQYPSPDPSPPTSPFQCPSPDPSPTSPSQCPSPDNSPPTSPSQCPSPDPSPPPSPSECSSPVPSPASSSAQSLSPVIIPHQTSSQCHSLELNKLSSVESNHSGANEPPSPLTGPKEFPGESSEKEEKHQGKEITEELSVLSFMDSSGVPASELRIKASQSPNEQVEGNSGKSSEIWPGEEEKKQRDEEADRCVDIKSEEEEMIIEVANEHREKGDMLESEGGSTLPLSVSSNTACPLRDIDILVDKHLEDFTSDLQLLLQEESGNSSFPQLSQTPLNTETSTSQCTLSYTLLPPFSHYVSFFNPCPPVQDYVNALKDSITCMLTEPDESWPGHEADPDRTDADASLAKTISDFVSSFRVASDVAGRNSEEFPAANVEPPISEVPLLSREDRVWQADETNWRSSPSPQLSSSYQNTYKPETSSEISRTITQNIEEAQDNSAIRTVVCSAEKEREGSSAGLNCIVMVPGYSHASDTSAELPLPEPASSPSPVPSTTHLSSIIHQLNPDVLNKVVEIAKRNIKRKSLQFYIHCTEAGDLVCEEVKEHILNLGNVQQNPVDFLHQENSENGLLVIIKNKDIAGHVHEIPDLTALKRHSSVMFVGIDSLDDIRNDSCIELFVSGGLIISDELIFSSDVFTHDRLSALLRLLEQHSSLESVWKWLIHCKTQKKLKKQARFSSHAANILDLLTTYQKRQIIEFLPYHHCDMTDHQSCNLDCFIELQARYTQFRHTIYLTGHPLEKLPTYSSKGIIVTSVEEILQNFSSLVGCQSVRDKQLFVEVLLAPKGLSRPLIHQDSISSYERSPSTLPEHIHPISSSSLPLEFLPQPTSTQLFLPQLSNEIVPDSSCKNSLSPTTSRDMKFLQQAIQQLRAQRLEQQQQLKLEQQRLEMQMESSDYRLPICAESETPHLVNEEPTEPVQLMACRKTIATNVELVLQHPSTEGPGRQGSPGGDELGEQRESNLVRGVQLHTESWISTKNDSSTYLSSQTSGVTEPSEKTEPPHDRSAEEIDQQAEPETFTAEDFKSRDTQLIQDQPVKAGVNPKSSSTAGFTTKKKIPVLTAREFKPALKKQHPQPSLQLPYPSTRQTQMVVPVQQSSMAPFRSQPFHLGPSLRQLHPLGGIGSFVAPAHLRPQVLTPTGTPLVWGFQQTGVDFLEEYYKPGGPAAHVYRGARPGGGF